MIIRLISALAFAALPVWCAQPPVALYYSFDQPPSAALFSELQTEFNNIVSPSDIPVEWQQIGSAGGREYRDIFVIRFHGACTLTGDKSAAANTFDDRVLAETQVSDGRVLPFADVHCDLLRRFIGNAGESVIGRAIARVAAHELYHMLTESTSHCRHGIAQAEYTREDLTGPTFRFAPRETELLLNKANPPEAYTRDSNFLLAR